jgi:hypothetical protein
MSAVLYRRRTRCLPMQWAFYGCGKRVRERKKILGVSTLDDAHSVLNTDNVECELDVIPATNEWLTSPWARA